jgi:hypothetical protein
MLTLKLWVGSQVPCCVTNNRFQAPSCLYSALALAADITHKIAAKMQAKVHGLIPHHWQVESSKLEMI